MSGRMTGAGRGRLRRFGRTEDGSAVTQFVLALPVVFGMFLMTVDSGLSTTRDALLDKAVAMTARSIRQGTLGNPTVADIRGDLCKVMTVFPNCATTLKVQVIALPRSDVAVPAVPASCADQGNGVTPVRRYVAGQTNGFVLLRACIPVESLTPVAMIPGPRIYDVASSTILAGSVN